MTAEVVIRREQRELFVDDWIEIGVAGVQLVCGVLVVLGLALWALSALMN